MGEYHGDNDMSHHDLDEMHRIGRVMDCGGVKPSISHIRRILHRIACAWMQCDEAPG